MATHRILCNVDHASVDTRPPWRGWSVHFIDVDGRTRIGPWLLVDRAQVDAIVEWGNISDREHFECAMRAWSRTSEALMLSDQQRAALIERGRTSPWDGYQLTQMMLAGSYPRKRATERYR